MGWLYREPCHSSYRIDIFACEKEGGNDQKIMWSCSKDVDLCKECWCFGKERVGGINKLFVGVDMPSICCVLHRVSKGGK